MTRLGQVLFFLTTLAVHIQSLSIVAQDTRKAVGGFQIAHVSGTMQAMQLNQIKIVAEDKKEYFAVLSDQTSVQYRGTAEPDFLMPGLLVRFSGELNQSGQVQGPVKELEIFTLSQRRRVSPEQAREQTTGVYQVGGEDGSVKKPVEKTAHKTSAKKSRAAANDTQAYRVVGQIVGAKAGKIFLHAGGVQVQFELDPKAVIKVISHDAAFCQIGDQVKVSGLRTAGQEQFIQSESVEIIGAKPLGPAEGKTAQNAKPTKATRGKVPKSGTARKDAAPDDKKTESRKTTPKK